MQEGLIVEPKLPEGRAQLAVSGVPTLRNTPLHAAVERVLRQLPYRVGYSWPSRGGAKFPHRQTTGYLHRPRMQRCGGHCISANSPLMHRHRTRRLCHAGRAVWRTRKLHETGGQIRADQKPPDLRRRLPANNARLTDRNAPESLAIRKRFRLHPDLTRPHVRKRGQFGSLFRC
jgi:hypothetical protein